MTPTTPCVPPAIATEITQLVKGAGDPIPLLNELQRLLHSLSPLKAQPVGCVQWVPLTMVEANDWNPNSVAKNEMKLLLHSIESDGYTQPIVTLWNPARSKYTVIDGFHRYTVCRESEEIRGRCQGRIPIVVINKSVADQMASTIRHNRARGKHSVAGMSNLVFQMLEEGRTDAEVCENLGMEPDELLRLKHITGFAKLFENVEYRKAWETSKQLRIRQKWEREHAGENTKAVADQAIPQ